MGFLIAGIALVAILVAMMLVGSSHFCQDSDPSSLSSSRNRPLDGRKGWKTTTGADGAAAASAATGTATAAAGGGGAVAGGVSAGIPVAVVIGCYDVDGGGFDGTFSLLTGILSFVSGSLTLEVDSWFLFTRFFS